MSSLAERSSLEEQISQWREFLRHRAAIHGSDVAELEDGERVRATFDPRQVGEDRVSSVQFLKLHTRGRTPVALGIDHPALQVRTVLGEGQRAALAADLAS